jgi:hypothetical protein
MKRRNPNAGLFCGFWLDANGKKTRRLARSEYPQLYELWRKHADIRVWGKHAPAVALGVRPIGEKARRG